MDIETPMRGFLAWRSSRRSPCEETPGDENRRIVVDRAVGKLQAQGDESSPAARGVLRKVEAPRVAARLELVDEMNRETERLERRSNRGRIRAAAEGDGGDRPPSRDLFQPLLQAADRLDARLDHCTGARHQRVSGLTPARIDADDAGPLAHGVCVRTITIGIPPKCG